MRALLQEEEQMHMIQDIGAEGERGPAGYGFIPEVYQRVEQILDALPETAGQATRTRAYNLVMALLAEDIAGRLELERVTEGREADG